MKILLSLCLLALAFSPIKSQCIIANCQSCENPGAECSDCPDGYVLSEDKKACIECGNYCEECTADAEGNTECVMDGCIDGTYRTDAGACELCSDGCISCSLDTNNIVVCDECDDGFVQDTSAADQACTACPSNCQTCNLVDGAAVCTTCNSFPGQNIQGYFLKTADKTCKTCGSKANKCTDNGSGVASISGCYSGYVVKSDNTKCLTCPAECSTCSGEELSGVATCTACKDDRGNFLVDGECVACTEFCMSCADESNCGECKEGYRLDSGSCVECPANCEECSLDDESNDVCDTCEDFYGEKTSSSITCDKCSPANCKVCSIDPITGAHTCSTCLDAYAKNGDGVCTACPTGCSSCEWVVADSYMKCTACKASYGGPVPAVDSSTVDTQSRCIACTRDTPHCTVCSAADPPVCTECEAAYYVDDSADCTARDVENCKTFVTTPAENKCGECNTGYGVGDGTACTLCTATACKTCDSGTTDVCTECADGWELTDIDGDSKNDCENCGISKCVTCASAKCTECVTGWTMHDSVTKSTTEGTTCKKCVAGCDTCTYDYDTNVASCDSDGCSAGYAYDGNGVCEACPDNCAACTFADGSTSCSADSCDDGFALNENSFECDACPDNCEECEWDSDSSQVVCKDDQCESGYGKISGGQCAECPDHCDICSVEDVTDAPDTLTCTTCDDG